MMRVASRPPVTGRRHVSRSGMDAQTARFHRLLLSFPALKLAGRALIPSGGDPWDLDEFVRWACCDTAKEQQCAARFVLGLWNENMDWPAYARQELGIRQEITHRVCHFDVGEAMRVWSKADRAVFLNWVKEPIYP